MKSSRVRWQPRTGISRLKTLPGCAIAGYVFVAVYRQRDSIMTRSRWIAITHAITRRSAIVKVTGARSRRSINMQLSPLRGLSQRIVVPVTGIRTPAPLLISQDDQWSSESKYEVYVSTWRVRDVRSRYGKVLESFRHSLLSGPFTRFLSSPHLIVESKKFKISECA